ncbi:MAG TPA: TIGR02679 domain-containing protein [Pseudonocardiaceae bacterium]
MGIEDEARAAYDRPELAEVWRLARAALEEPGARSAFAVDVRDEATAAALRELLRRPRPLLVPSRVPLSLHRLREHLAAHRFGLSLEQVLELVHGRPVQPGSGAGGGDEGRRRTAEVLTRALATHGLADAPWVEPWIDQVHRYGKLTHDELTDLAGPVAAVLARLHLDPTREPSRRVTHQELTGLPEVRALRAELRAALGRVVLGAAALAHGTAVPRTDLERWGLWERAGVASAPPPQHLAADTPPPRPKQP